MDGRRASGASASRRQQERAPLLQQTAIPTHARDGSSDRRDTPTTVTEPPVAGASPKSPVGYNRGRSPASRPNTARGASSVGSQRSKRTAQADLARFAARSPHVAAEKEVGETLFGTSLKVITCGLGAGILAVPWGAAGASLTVSYAVVAFVLAVNLWTLMIIVHALDRWGGTKVWDDDRERWVGTRRRAGYRIDDLGELLRQCPGQLPMLAVPWDVTVNLSNLGALVGYMIVTGDSLTPLMPSGCDVFSNRRLWIILASAVCLPLCWVDLAFLTWSSAAGVAANIYLFAVVVGVLISDGTADDVCMLGTGPGVLTCTCNIVFSICMQMVIPEYYTQLRRDDQNPESFLRWVLIPSFIFIFILFCAFATAGVLAYGPTVDSNMLNNFPHNGWGKSTRVAITIACLMVYPNMLRPMVQPLLRGGEWASSAMSVGVRAWRRGGGPEPETDSNNGENDEPLDVYEGRLVHTELCGPVSVDAESGEANVEVVDTRGFEKDALVFLDGRRREYAIVKEVLIGDSPTHYVAARAGPGRGSLRLRPRFGHDAVRPVADAEGRPAAAVSRGGAVHPVGTKVVLDEDPVLVTAAVAGESCLHMSFTNGIAPGARIVVGEGARMERHCVERTLALRPEGASQRARLRTHDLVLRLSGALAHNHGAHSRVALDHGATRLAATAIVAVTAAVSCFIDDLGVVNVINGAISVAIIDGLVPGFLAWQLWRDWAAPDAVKETPPASPEAPPEWDSQAVSPSAADHSPVRSVPSSSCQPTLRAEPEPTGPAPPSLRFRTPAVLLIVGSIAVGIGSVFFTENHSHAIVRDCSWFATAEMHGT